MNRNERALGEDAVQKKTAAPTNRNRLSLRKLFIAFFLCCLILASGSSFGIATLVPALGVTSVYLLSESGLSISSQTRLLLVRLGGIVYCLSLFLICIRMPVITNADPASLCGWECLFISFGSSIHSLQDSFEHLNDWQVVLAARELLALAVFTGFCCSAGTVFKWITLEFGKRIGFVDSVFSLAILLATPATWIAPLLFGQVSLGYLVWAVSVYVCYLASSKNKSAFYVLFFETLAILLAIRFLGFPN